MKAIAAMFNRSEIMKAAWKAYRAWHASGLRCYGVMAFDRWKFSMFLRNAWDQARKATMTQTERRAVTIKRQIETLEYKSFRYDIITMRRGLEAELASLF